MCCLCLLSVEGEGSGTLLTWHASPQAKARAGVLSLGSTTNVPLGTREKGRPLEELLGGHLPLTSLSPLGSCHETVSHHLQDSDEMWGSLPCLLTLELQNIQLLSCSLELAPQHQGLPQVVLQAYDPFCVSVALFGVLDEDYWDLGPGTLGLFFFSLSM